MTEGDDRSDDRPTEDDGDDSREQDINSDRQWDQPWPSERESGTQYSDGERQTPKNDSTGRDSSTRFGTQEAEEERATRGYEQKGSSPSRETYPVDGQKQVEITDEARDDREWIDLGEQRPKGEALAIGDLTPEELLEYTTDRRSLNPLVQVHWGIRVTIGATIAGLIASWGLGTLGYSSQLGGAVVGLLVLIGLVWVALYYRLWVYQVRADAIYLERGVVTHVRSLVPYVRIQHVDTSQSPIERMLGLSTLVVYTAGSRGADVSIPGLLPDEARDLQRRVKELAIEAEGDDAL